MSNIGEHMPSAERMAWLIGFFSGLDGRQGDLDAQEARAIIDSAYEISTALIHVDRLMALAKATYELWTSQGVTFSGGTALIYATEVMRALEDLGYDSRAVPERAGIVNLDHVLRISARLAGSGLLGELQRLSDALKEVGMMSESGEPAYAVPLDIGSLSSRGKIPRGAMVTTTKLGDVGPSFSPDFGGTYEGTVTIKGRIFGVRYTGVEGGMVQAQLIDHPGVITVGKTTAEAALNLNDAYFEYMNHGNRTGE